MPFSIGSSLTHEASSPRDGKEATAFSAPMCTRNRGSTIALMSGTDISEVLKGLGSGNGECGFGLGSEEIGSSVGVVCGRMRSDLRVTSPSSLTFKSE